MRVNKQDAGGTAFADLVWKPVVLVETKIRGADLQKHYRQRERGSVEDGTAALRDFQTVSWICPSLR